MTACSNSPTATPAWRAVTLFTTETTSGKAAVSRSASVVTIARSSKAVMMFTIQPPFAAEFRSMAKRQNPAWLRSPYTGRPEDRMNPRIASRIRLPTAGWSRHSAMSITL